MYAKKMTIKVGEEYKVYWIGKSRRAKVTAILKGQPGEIRIAWKYYYGFSFGWSPERVSSPRDFKEILGEQIDSIEV